MKLAYLIPIIIVLYLIIHFLLRTTKWIIKFILAIGVAVIIFFIFFS